MAKAKKGKVTTITVADLAEEYGMEGRKIRMLIRGSGRKAPAVEGQEGFGPRAKYEWKSNSKELKEVRKLITEAQKAEAAKPKATKKKTTKKGKKGKENEDTEDEEEDEDEDEEEDDDDEDDEDEDDDD